MLVLTLCLVFLCVSVSFRNFCRSTNTCVYYYYYYYYHVSNSNNNSTNKKWSKTFYDRPHGMGVFHWEDLINLI